MKCFVCNKGTFEKRPVNMTGERNGEEFTVQVDGLSCSNCDFETIDNEQSGQLTRLVSDAYRKKQVLLTGPEIKAAREKLSMSQRDFADYLGVGSASVKRWESGQIQDRAMDRLMRLRSDPEEARMNYEALSGQSAAPCFVYLGKPMHILFPESVVKYDSRKSAVRPRGALALKPFTGWEQQTASIC